MNGIHALLFSCVKIEKWRGTMYCRGGCLQCSTKVKQVIISKRAFLQPAATATCIVPQGVTPSHLPLSHPFLCRTNPLNGLCQLITCSQIWMMTMLLLLNIRFLYRCIYCHKNMPWAAELVLASNLIASQISPISQIFIYTSCKCDHSIEYILIALQTRIHFLIFF